MIQVHPFSHRASLRQAHLRVLSTTDLHVHVLPFDYYADRDAETAGLARTAALIRRVRAECSNCLLLDNGDFLQGGPMGDYIAYSRGLSGDKVHPVIAAMNTLGYDAATLGNHEFNYGLSFLDAAMAKANFPFVCANALRTKATDPTQDETYVAPYVILDRQLVDGAGACHPIRIGIIGLLPPQFTTWDRSVLHDSLTSRDIVEAAAAHVPQMRREGADIVIALSHSGIGAADAVAGMENASVALAGIDGIDAVITGHTHMVFPSAAFAGMPGVDAVQGTLAGKPAVMGGFWGSHLGMIDLLLERGEGSGGWKVVASRSEARPIARRSDGGLAEPLIESDPQVMAAVADDHLETLNYMRREVGNTHRPLHSYFALIANSASVQLVCRAQAWHLRDRLAGTVHAGLPLLSAAAPFKAGGRAGPEHYTDVPMGGMELRNVADLYSYPNTICAVRINGAQVADWLERSAGIFNQVKPGRADQLLLNLDFPCYNFDVIMGVTYEIDPSKPTRFSASGQLVDATARRIVNLRWQGRPLDPKAEFIVATNNYRVSTCANLSNPAQSKLVYAAPVTNREILLAYIAQHPAIDPLTEPNWTFSPLPGTSLLFDTSPMAGNHVADLLGMSVERAGDAPGGFARYRIHVCRQTAARPDLAEQNRLN